jgi:hypothetical protein
VGGREESGQVSSICRFSVRLKAKKIGVFLKNQCYDQHFA